MLEPTPERGTYIPSICHRDGQEIVNASKPISHPLDIWWLALSGPVPKSENQQELWLGDEVRDLCGEGDDHAELRTHSAITHTDTFPETRRRTIDSTSNMNETKRRLLCVWFCCSQTCAVLTASDRSCYFYPPESCDTLNNVNGNFAGRGMNMKGRTRMGREQKRCQRPHRFISFSTSINGMHFNPFNYGSLLQLPQIKLLCKPRKDT